MATLPDIDTTTVSFIGYWNAISNTSVDSIEPEDVLDDNSIETYTLYDNGVAGDYTSASGRTVRFRVKNDGWMTAHIDRSNSWIPNNGSPPRGEWDIANDWTSATNNSTLNQNSLERCIYSLASRFSNWGTMEAGYATGDVGLYNYAHPDATTTSLLTAQQSGQNEHVESHYHLTQTGGYLYTSGTTRDLMAGLGSARESGDNYRSRVRTEGVEIADNADAGSRAYGVRDLVAEGLCPSADTEYTMDVQAGSGSYDPAYAQGGIFMVWY